LGFLEINSMLFQIGFAFAFVKLEIESEYKLFLFYSISKMVGVCSNLLVTARVSSTLTKIMHKTGCVFCVPPEC